MSVNIYPSPPGPLPKRQAEMLALIDAIIARGKPFPPDTVLATAMGWKNPASATDCLLRLAWRGKIRRGVDGEDRWVRIDATRG